MQSIIEIKSLRKEYEEFVLDNISMDVPDGYITGIIGLNGAGKTTTIKLIMNLIRADGGEVRVFGEDSKKSEIETKNRIGYVGEEHYFYEQRSANWTGKFVSHFFDRWDQKRFNTLLAEFEIPPKKRINKFSKGMKAKLSLAIALSHSPEVIMLDEPTAGLDPIIRRELLDHLQKFTEDQKKSVVISSHITDDITRIADYIAYMINGRIALFAAKDELLSDWKKIHFSKGSLTNSIITSMKNVEEHMFGMSGITKNYLDIKDALKPGMASGDIKVENAGLDDILICLVKEK